MTLPPAQPTYILRGHGSQIHVTTFIRYNSRLFTGDEQGWVVLWDLATRRSTAVWKAHQASILGLGEWDSDKLITHGRDNKLLVWKLREEDESLMFSILPIDATEGLHKQPWLLYSLDVNTMNFCSFAQTNVPEKKNPTEILIAVPDTLGSEKVDIFHLPSSSRLYTVPISSRFKGGMVMTIKVFHHYFLKLLTVVTGFESGCVSVNQLVNSTWMTLYISQPHSQPVLSISIAPDQKYFLTSSADAIIALHVIQFLADESPDTKIMDNINKDTPARTFDTKHSGQQDLKIRNDGRIFATAGWDGRVRVYSCKTLRELAVLKWHKIGCYAVAFTDIDIVSTQKEKFEDFRNDNLISYPEIMDVKAEEQVQMTNQVTSSVSTSNISELRRQKSRNTHWIAVGSKDGKISLWDIY